MNSEELEHQLRNLGFLEVQRYEDERTGSSEVVLTDDVVDIAIFNDRGERGVTLGTRGEDRYVIPTWITTLGMNTLRPTTVSEQAEWIIANLPPVRTAVTSDAGLGKRLHGANWALLRERLGLPPGAVATDPSTWR